MKKSNKPLLRAGIIIAAAFVLIIAVIMFNPVQEKSSSEAGRFPAVPVQPEPVIPEPSPVPEPQKPAKTIYIILDDGGHNLEQLKPFLEFPGKLTVAVLPHLAYSAEAAEAVHAAGKTVILHQPMEAIGKNNPGPGAIYVSMNSDEVKSILRKNLDSVPHAEGLNNHMGSAATMDLKVMDSVMEVVKKRGIFFIDSFTHSKSVCSEVAEKHGLAIAKRDVFLDNVDTKEKIMEAINQGKETADKKGYAVMIGHVWSQELADTMMEIYPDFIEEGYCFGSAADFFILKDKE